MYSAHNERKYVVAERFTRILKNEICKYIAAISKILYFDKLDDKVNKHNNTYRTIKIELVDVMYIEYDLEHNDKDPKFRVGDDVRISKYKNLLQKTAIQIGQKKFLLLKKLKILYYGNMPLVILTVKNLLEHFVKKKQQKSENLCQGESL